MKKAKLIAAIIMSALLIVLTSCGKNILKKAYEEIITEYPSAVLCFEISDDGSFISVDTNPYDIDDYSVSGAFSAIPASMKSWACPTISGKRCYRLPHWTADRRTGTVRSRFPGNIIPTRDWKRSIN